MGLTFSEVRHMYFGKWQDLFEVWKLQYNFETNKIVYQTAKDLQAASLDVL